MATQAKITFTSLNRDSDLPARTLSLHPYLRTIQIGRASKTPSKGLQSAVDNAWFDSPVMSRNHAEISMDNETKIITIRDIGSMHGTFVNDFQLRRDEPQELSNDDLVVFGAEVKRNSDTFPACAFRINYELFPFKLPILCHSSFRRPSSRELAEFDLRANTSYAFPESDDEDYEISDEDANQEPSSEDAISIETPPRKASQVINAVDLTADDSLTNSDMEYIGETSVEKTIINVVTGRSADIDHSTDPSDVEYGDDASSAAADSMDEQSAQDSENEASVHKMDEEEGAAESLAQLIGVAACNMRANIEAPNKMVDRKVQDDESDFGLPDAGAEGIRALFDEGLIESSGDPYYNGDEESKSDSLVECKVPAAASMADDILDTPKDITFAGLPLERSAELISSFHHFDAFKNSSLSVGLPSPITLNARQPSPSDAAMVKTGTPSTPISDLANPVTVHHMPSQDFQKLPAQSLSDKIGKHAFFAAREDNRAKISAGDQPERSLSISLPSAEERRTSLAKRAVEGSTVEDIATEKRTLGTNQRSLMLVARYRRNKRRREEEAKSKLSESSKSLPITLPATTAAKSTIFSGPTYLDDHTQTLKVLPAPSPEPDMKSAVTHNQSKAHMASANTQAKPSGRSCLSINDIIEGGTCDNNSKTLKRKADDISETIENEIRIWASSSSALDGLEESTAIPALTLTPQAAARKDQSETTLTPPKKISEQRPAKRLRKVVESIAYVALGSATLFGALVLSAPDFV